MIHWVCEKCKIDYQEVGFDKCPQCHEQLTPYKMKCVLIRVQGEVV
jgi:uncharacterized protein (UPF0212 family)